MDRTQPQEDKLYRFRELAGKNVYSQVRGEQFGVVDDLMIDPNLLEVAAIVTAQGKALKRNMQMIPSVEVKTWERDAVLVNRASEANRLDELPEREKWLSVADHLIGSEVVTTTGKRLGKLDDITIDENGRIAGYELEEPDQENSTGYEGRTGFIPGIATHSLGAELLIINAKDLAWILD